MSREISEAAEPLVEQPVRELDVSGWLARVPEWETEARLLETRARAIRQVIDGVRFLNGETSVLRVSESDGQVYEVGRRKNGEPRGRRAALAILSEAPGRTWKLVEVRRELLRRGWSPSPKAVDAVFKRLRDEGIVEQPRYGHYKLTQTAPQPPKSGSGRTEEPKPIGESRETPPNDA